VEVRISREGRARQNLRKKGREEGGKGFLDLWLLCTLHHHAFRDLMTSSKYLHSFPIASKCGSRLDRPIQCEKGLNLALLLVHVDYPTDSFAPRSLYVFRRVEDGRRGTGRGFDCFPRSSIEVCALPRGIESRRVSSVVPVV